VPKRHIPGYIERERERVGGGKNYFCLAAAARAAPRPQGRARCVRWGLRRGFLFCGPFSPGHGVPAPHTRLHRGWGESAGGGKKQICLTAAARAAPRPPGPRALCEVGLAARSLFFAVRFSPGYRAPAPHPSLQRESTREIVAGGKNYLCLTVAARAALRPQGHFPLTFWKRLGKQQRGAGSCTGSPKSHDELWRARPAKKAPWRAPTARLPKRLRGRALHTAGAAGS
jgi:hypothetical protein